MQYDGDKIAVYDENRIAMECQIISQFKNEVTGKNYLVYTDNTRNEEGKKNMYVVSFNPDASDEDTLTPIESMEEWESISGFLEELRKAIDENGLDL
jgi:uncharacterized protein YrzB (UPF0473 family)